MRDRRQRVVLWTASLLALSFAALPPAAAAVTPHSPPLKAPRQTPPAASSGQPYLWKLTVEGGTPPYRCIKKKLELGTLELNAACQITGRAPVVHSKSVTGPFRFVVQDSSRPRKTAVFPSMSFTVLAPSTSTASSPVPSGFVLIASATGDAANSWEASPPDKTIENPLGVDVRVTGSGALTTVSASCQVSSSYPEIDRSFNGAGLFSVPIPAGSLSCDIGVISDGGFGNSGAALQNFTVQVYAKTGGPTTTTTSPTAYPYDGTWTGTFSFTLSTPGSGELNYTVPARATVTAGVVGNFTAGQSTGVPSDFDLNGFAEGRAPMSISASGLAALYWQGVAGPDSASFGGYEPADPAQLCNGGWMQFTATTAKNTVPFSCQGTDFFGDVVTLINGDITLTLTSPAGG